MNKLFGNRKTRLRNLLLVVLPFVLLIGVFGFTAYKSVTNMISGGTTAPSKEDAYNIASMDYHLRSNATEYQKELFKELKDAIAADDGLKIAECVAKNFIADFYTWTNKSASYDVGGMYYVYSPQKKKIYKQARDMFYNNLDFYIEKYGSENLLEPKNIVVTKSFKSDEPYEQGNNLYPEHYGLTLEWEYEDHKNFTEKEYRTREYFQIIKNGDRYEIVVLFGD